jgi:anti-anti-sigma factor
MSDLSDTLAVTTDRWSDCGVVVRLAGALDGAGGRRLIDEATHIDPGAGDRVVVQLHDVTFLDAAGICALFYTQAFVEARGGTFAISTTSPRFRAVLLRAGLGRYCSPDDSRRAHRPDASSAPHPNRRLHTPTGSR